MRNHTVRVLLVEDDQDDYFLTRELLAEIEGTRFELDWAASYGTAQEAIARQEHDVYLLDYRLGEHNGLDLLREAVRRGCQGPLILLTGHGDRQVDLEAMTAGAADYLIKAQISSALLERSLRYAIERKRTETTLKVQSRVLESMAEGVSLVDEQGTILFSNPAFDAMFGYEHGELIGQAATVLNDGTPEENRHLLAHIAEQLQTQGAWVGEIRNRKKDGTPFLTETHVSTLEMSGKTYRVSVKQDITGRKNLEEQLRQAQKMEGIGRLAGGVAHDFNNLLTGILGYSELNFSKLAPGDPVRADLNEIKKLAERAASLTRQLLVFSRRQILAFEVLDLNTVVADMDKMLHRLIGEDVELMTVLTPALCRVKADLGQMEQVILNLAVNARDAMPRGGTLTIRTHNVDLEKDRLISLPGVGPGRYVLLEVRDTGCGMDERVKAHLFEPFFTTKPVGAGTGLGLATIYGIVEQTGGHIEVQSEVGRGTAFKIYLPCTEETISQPSSPQALSSSPRSGETVLLVEDEPSVRTLVSTVLRANGYTLLEAREGIAALEISAQHPGPIHLLITDVVMPRMSGRELAERLVSLRPDMRLLYLSGYTDDTVVRHGVREAEMPFIQKPFSPAALVRKVREVLDQPKDLQHRGS
jgi:PAS domain S-box-containing protein